MGSYPTRRYNAYCWTHAVLCCLGCTCSGTLTALQKPASGLHRPWQKITLRPTESIIVIGPGVMPFKWLLDSHTANTLVIHAAQELQLRLIENFSWVEGADRTRIELEAMLRSRITS